MACTGSKKNVNPSSGLGAKPRDPDTIESMIDSPSALAVASTAAATIAGLAVRSDTRQVVRQRLTPSAADPSVHARGTVSSALTMIATMIGTIITVRIKVATVRFAPVSCTTYSTERLRWFEIRLCSIHGAIARIPISPYTTDGTPASSRIIGSITRLTAGRGELHDEHRREDRHDHAEDRPPAPRSGSCPRSAATPGSGRCSGPGSWAR